MDVVAIVLQGLLGLVFVMAGFSKISGTKMQVDSFNHYGYPQWFRVVTGLVQWVGVAALVIGFWEPSWAAVGALWLGVTMLGGVLTHVRIRDTFKQTLAAIVFLLLLVILFIIELPELSDFPGF
ncbi:DoxX family protein [Cohnella lupini]|uniref:DoxX-like protein n=1 Tax=Cohnella lupini TaxID=1294267 RepID=A0A3D9I8G4_9BACL|nr:DoxX family protein [Cohnella lupini]RED58084.1 DoxX-like protein [Cohnella lupini]